MDFATSSTPYWRRFLFTKEDGLLNHMDYFLAKSLGCVGLLKPWLQRAVGERSLKSKDQTLTREILEATAYKNRDLLKIMKEMKVGEQLLKDIDLRDLAVTMGFEATPSLKLRTPPVGENSKGNATRSSIRKARKVGARNPSRDPVGGNWFPKHYRSSTQGLRTSHQEVDCSRSNLSPADLGHRKACSAMQLGLPVHMESSHMSSSKEELAPAAEITSFGAKQGDRFSSVAPAH